MGRIFLLLTAVCLSVAEVSVSRQVTPAESANPRQLVRLFESRYRAVHTLRATFLERYSENGRLVRAETGTAYFRRPRKMRWEYESPEKNLFLVDGKSAWFYVPADHTVTRVRAKESADWRTPLALLAGEMKVSRVCSQVRLAVEEKAESPGNAVLYCEVRGGQAESQKSGSPNYSQNQQTGQIVFFEIARTTGELARLLIRDAGGVTVEFHFGNWRSDTPLDESLFRFHPPPGVAIVNGDLAAVGPGISP